MSKLREQGWLRVALVKTRKVFYLPTWLIASLVLMSALFCQAISYPRPIDFNQGEESAIARDPLYGWPMHYYRIYLKSGREVYSPQGIAFDVIASVLVVLSSIVTTESLIDAYINRIRPGISTLFVLTAVVASFLALYRANLGYAIFAAPTIVQVIMIFGVASLNYAVLKSFMTVLREMD